MTDLYREYMSVFKNCFIECFKFYYSDIFNSHERPLELSMPVENTNYN